VAAARRHDTPFLVAGPECSDLMTPYPKSILFVVTLSLAACQREAEANKGNTPSGVTAGAAGEAKPALADEPIAGYQRELLQLAFDAASKFPSDPHSKNRGRAQDLVVAASLRLQQPLLALHFAPDVEGWRRGVAFADVAWCAAKAGDDKRARSLVKLARRVLQEQVGDANAQQWRADKIRVKIARALATLGDDAKSRDELGKVAPDSTGAVDAGWTMTLADRVKAMTREEAGAELQRITDTFLAQALGEQFTSLMLLSGIHGQFFGDEKLRAELEERLFVRFHKLPTKLRLDAIAPLVGHYVDNGDRNGGRDIIVKMTELMSQFQFRTEERIPLLARIGELRKKCGDEGRAQEEFVAALKDYHESRDALVNIYRCETLRPLALAWHAFGDAERANDLVALALEESQENPNSRPRCDDLVETCIALAEHELEPSAELWQRMREISEGLSTPW